VIVGGLDNVGVDVGFEVGLAVGLAVGRVHSPHVNGQNFFTFGKVHLYCVFFLATHVQRLFCSSPVVGNTNVKRPLESTHSLLSTLRVILGREIEATTLWKSLLGVVEEETAIICNDPNSKSFVMSEYKFMIQSALSVVRYGMVSLWYGDRAVCTLLNTAIGLT
jgi:hypothetical protein